MLIYLLCYCWCIAWVASSILDPSLYLSPGPPLAPSSSELSPNERWLQTKITRPERDANNQEELSVIPLDDKNNKPDVIPKLEEPAEAMDQAETFWTGLDTHSFGVYGVPLSYKPSGLYGTYGFGVRPSGSVATSYGTFGGDEKSVGVYGKSGLAGSTYGTYGYGGLRFYGSESGPSWTGWGNGKWGHYGKG